MIEKNEKTNAATGHLAIQQALNHIQVEELTQAEVCLDKWVPLDHDKPSRIEQVVQFRKSVILGRIMRYQGWFVESDAHLQHAYAMVKQIKDLHFDEDRRDLICEIADTSRELEDLEPAETHLRAELSHWGQHSQGPAFSGKSLLDACLAEILFARGKYDEAKTLCDEVRSRRNLLKFTKLRISVVLAKICHVRDDYGGAMGHWNEALQAIAGFELRNGRTTRMIVLSQGEALGKLGHAEIRDQSRKQAVVLDELVKPGGTLYWIAGMRHWQRYLESGATRSRI
jgi:predicted negative regulator of RcsB-dependent stress response